MNERVKAILNFWFIKSDYQDYFKRSKYFDKKIKNNFKNDYFKAINNKLDSWQNDPQSCLALVILLDQFSRNLYRNNSLAFAHDYKSRLIVNEAIDRGYLENIKINEKFFFILPLIHSEDINDHIFAHSLCETYLKDHPKYQEIKKSFDNHTITIKKFSRYPHRNKILERDSTEEEDKFLLGLNSS